MEKLNRDPSRQAIASSSLPAGQYTHAVAQTFEFPQASSRNGVPFQFVIQRGHITVRHPPPPTATVQNAYGYVGSHTPTPVAFAVPVRALTAHSQNASPPASQTVQIQARRVSRPLSAQNSHRGTVLQPTATHVRAAQQSLADRRRSSPIALTVPTRPRTAHSQSAPPPVSQTVQMQAQHVSRPLSALDLRRGAVLQPTATEVWVAAQRAHTGHSHSPMSNALSGASAAPTPVAGEKRTRSEEQTDPREAKRRALMVPGGYFRCPTPVADPVSPPAGAVTKLTLSSVEFVVDHGFRVLGVEEQRPDRWATIQRWLDHGYE
ncbi:hypothetical protein FA95DRAFT_1129053 [Auriscalpium vulgare]|uniref:Uncharacterized protein n=1 Tax=Auriscalpium vulgare TaxID=40419 RepID=A0ACB8RWW4_9AGAM|nr:hypothetical protein FA95DRAFT_1129053 [Auriscalpium vulgare]